MHTRKLVQIFVLVFFTLSIQAQDQQVAAMEVAMESKETAMAEMLAGMTAQEKIGQLFMVSAYSRGTQAEWDKLESLVRNYHLGGVITMQGGPGRQLQLITQLQKAAKYPLLIGQDAEWGQAMRLDSTYKFPTQLTVGAAANAALTKDWARAMALECEATGVHISFSPVLDVNTNAANPIIGARSFGSDPQRVAQLGLAAIDGFQEQGVLACGKHFPGHGDTHQDSHKTLPKVDRTLEELEAVEWVPFKAAAQHGAASFMIAHLNIPAMEPTGRPTSLSKAVVQGVLRDSWGYDGLAITDALNMKGAANFAPPGEVELAAFLAGNDILLFPENVERAVKRMEQALEDGTITMDQLDQRVSRIWKAKTATRAYEHWRNVQSGQMLTTASHDQLGNEKAHWNIQKNAITAVPSEVTLPVANLLQPMVHLSLGHPQTRVLNTYLDKYVEMNHYHGAVPEKELDQAEIIVVSFHQDPKSPWKRYKLNAEELAEFNRVKASGKTVYVLHFANPYGLPNYGDFGQNARVLVGYENDSVAQMLVPQVLFGGRAAKGVLPVDLGTIGAAGMGEQTRGNGRLSYGPAWEVSVDAFGLNRIDSTMNYAIDHNATPGGQILVARNGTVFYDKSFGAQTYGGKPVQWKDLYDLASVTKITATLPGIMQWYEKQPLLLKSTLGNHTRRLDGSGKEYLVFDDVLAHQSGLAAWVPYYLRTIKTDSAKAYWYTDNATEGYTMVRPGMYVRETIRDTIFSMLAASEMKAKEYRYSDLGYYLFQEMIEERFNEPIDRWAASTFYEPLGAKRLTYNPLDHGFTLDEIVPTEEDNYWRNTTVHGQVHDMGAALLGGVAGHAGLFANSNDLAKMMQMYLSGGYYGGHQYLQPETIETFRTCAFCELNNRRGRGFDRPQIADGPGPSCTCASDLSFGHTGFTGTMVWMDPKEDLLYIFLSNRTFPDAENWKLSKLDVRTNIQEYIYDSLQ